MVQVTVSTNPLDHMALPPLCMIAIVGLLIWFGTKLEPTTVAANRVESWTGLRWLVSMTIYMEHSGYLGISCSGWFIMMSGGMLSLGRGGGGTCRGWAYFLIRRLARIFPAYWVALVFRMGIGGIAWSDWHTFMGLDDWVPAHHLWFISTVAHLYMLYPFISMFVEVAGTQRSVRRALEVAVFAYCIQLLMGWYLLSTPEDPYASEPFKEYRRSVFGYPLNFYHNPFTRLPLFLEGVCCAHASQQISEPWIRRLGYLTDVSLALFLLFLLTGTLIKNDCEKWVFGMLCEESIFLRTTMFSPILFVNMLGLGVGSKSSTQRIFTQPIILLMGKWSYGVYLWGVPQAKLDLLVTIASYLKTVAMAAVSFNVIEEPAQRLANWMTPSPVVVEESNSDSSGSDEESMTQKLGE